jgi:hypothetical protein
VIAMPDACLGHIRNPPMIAAPWTAQRMLFADRFP